MAQAFNYDTGQMEDLPEEALTSAVAKGTHGLPLGEVSVISPDGTPGTVPAEKAAAAFRAGFRMETAKESALREAGEHPGLAFAAAAGRGATFGLSDLALKKTGLATAEQLSNLQEANPIASPLGEVAGVVGSSLLLPGGGAVGAASKLGGVAEKGAARLLGEGVASRVASKAVGGALEGSLYGMGSAVSESALGDSELTAEKLLAGAGVGALLGGTLGAAGGAAREGLEAGRSRLNAYAAEKVAGADAAAAAKTAADAAEETASKRGAYGGEAQKSARMLENARALAEDPAVSEETKARLQEILQGDSAKELREVTARRVLEDFGGQAEKTLGAKAAFHEAADTEAARAAAKADDLLSPKEAWEQIKARAKRYGEPALGRVIGGIAGFIGGGPAMAMVGETVGGLALGQLRPSTSALKRMLEHPSVVKAFYGAIEKATQEAPQVFGRFAPVLASAAARGATDLAATHLALLEKAPGYAQQMSQAGFPLGTPEDDAVAALHGSQLDRVTAAVAQHDKRMDAMVDGFLKGEKSAAEGAARLASESRQNFEARAKQLANLATNPQALAEAFRLNPTLSVAAPGVSAALAATAARAVDFLHQKAPKSPQAPNMPALQAPWTPTDGQLATWEKYVRAVEKPSTVLEDLQKGTVTKEAVEALRAVYPKLADDVQQRLLERMANLSTRIPEKQRLALRVLMGPDFDAPSAGARQVLAQARAAYAANEAAKQGGRAPPPTAAQRNSNPLQTQSQRLEGRGGAT